MNTDLNTGMNTAVKGNALDDPALDPFLTVRRDPRFNHDDPDAPRYLRTDDDSSVKIEHPRPWTLITGCDAVSMGHLDVSSAYLVGWPRQPLHELATLFEHPCAAPVPGRTVVTSDPPAVDEVLVAELREQLHEQGLDAESVEESIAAMREQGTTTVLGTENS